MTSYRTFSKANNVSIIFIIFFYHYFWVASINHYYIISMLVINQFYTLPFFGFELVTFRCWWYIDLYALPLRHSRAWYYCS